MRYECTGEEIEMNDGDVIEIECVGGQIEIQSDDQSLLHEGQQPASLAGWREWHIGGNIDVKIWTKTCEVCDGLGFALPLD